MKQLLLMICFCPFFAKGQQIHKAGPHDIIFLGCTHGNFDVMDRTAGNEWIMSGNCSLSGNVAVKVGDVDIKCDSMVVTKNEMTAYNVHIGVTDPNVADVKGDLLKFDIAANKASLNGAVTFTKDGKLFHAQSASLDFEHAHYRYVMPGDK